MIYTKIYGLKYYEINKIYKLKYYASHLLKFNLKLNFIYGNLT